MAGSKPLNTQEINNLIDSFKNNRDKALFIFGHRTGYRISELLSLYVKDLIQFGKIKDTVTVSRKNMKGKVNSRTVVLHSEVKLALEQMGILSMNRNEKLFGIGRMQAHRIIKDAANQAQVQGKVTTHSMRKSFAQRIYEKVGKDLKKTQLATGHKSLNSLAHYLEAGQDEVNKAILEE